MRASATCRGRSGSGRRRRCRNAGRRLCRANVGRVVGHRLVKAIDVHIVVASSVHLGESHGNFFGVKQGGRTVGDLSAETDSPQAGRFAGILGANRQVSKPDPRGGFSRAGRVARHAAPRAKVRGQWRRVGGLIIRQCRWRFPRLAAVGVAVFGFKLFAVRLQRCRRRDRPGGRPRGAAQRRLWRWLLAPHRCRCACASGEPEAQAAMFVADRYS